MNFHLGKTICLYKTENTTTVVDYSYILWCTPKRVLLCMCTQTFSDLPGKFIKYLLFYVPKRSVYFYLNVWAFELMCPNALRPDYKHTGTYKMATVFLIKIQTPIFRNPTWNSSHLQHQQSTKYLLRCINEIARTPPTNNYCNYNQWRPTLLLGVAVATPWK